MAYQNQKVKARQVVTPNTQTQDLGIVSEVPMGDWNSTTQYQKLNLVRYKGATYIAKKQNQGFEPTVTSGWQENWQVVSYDGTGFTQQDRDNLERIEGAIPSSATAANPLATQDFVNSSINNMAAFYITYNASGDAFPSRASLLSAITFYYGGQVRTPTQNDYAIVLADESQTQGADGKYPTTRYSYQGSAWSFQYVVNNTSLTQAQVNAINSGITADLVSEIGTASKLSTQRAIDGVVFDGSTNITHYGVCNTSASTTIKDVQITGFTLVVGAKVVVKFTYTNTTNGPQLRVYSSSTSDGTAKTIYFPNSTTNTKNVLSANRVIEFIYDGTNWVMISGDPLATYPIGVVYISTDSTSPAQLFGGSWTAISSGYYLKAITSGTSSYGNAGLPNIKGNLSLRAMTGTGTTMTIDTQSGVTGLTGAFTTPTGETPDTQLERWSGSHGAINTSNSSTVYVQNVPFDASKSNSIYGSATTVTPNNFGVYMWRRTA